MRRSASLFVAIVMGCIAVRGQPTKAGPQPQNFHLKTTVKDANGAVIPEVKITLQSKHLHKVVTTNNVGLCEIDLPRGIYAITADHVGFKRYRGFIRPNATDRLMIDITMQVIDPKVVFD
jgi:Carboxypeptidase regulatory-like domain